MCLSATIVIRGCAAWLIRMTYGRWQQRWGMEKGVPSNLNNSNETHTFMCLGRAGCFGQHYKCSKIQIWNLNRLTHTQYNLWGRILAWKVKGKTYDSNHDLRFFAHTINCVCHSIRSTFRVLGIYNFAFGLNTLNTENVNFLFLPTYIPLTLDTPYRNLIT